MRYPVGRSRTFAVIKGCWRRNDWHHFQCITSIGRFPSSYFNLQLGRVKWADVCEDLRKTSGYMVSPRTLRGRVDTRVKKFKHDELKSKTGTEEQRSKRGILLTEIIAMIESQEAPPNTEFGASERNDDQDDHRQVSTASAISTNKRTSERAAADQEREVVFRQIYTDAPPDPNSARRKRAKTGEEDLVAIKLRHDMELENRRFELKAEIKRAELRNESRRIEMDLAREKRLAEETMNTQEILRGTQQTMQLVMKMFPKNN
ncbi:hypothetical protein MTP99_006925 [Tenebrio molitor]|nr:hypothetical protein MTP99_006925 [Tenebrio molitor]